MKYVDEFRNSKRVLKIADSIKAITPHKSINIMEVCGTHTQNFHRFGLAKLLPKNIRFISGPGCPICVSSQRYIDTAIILSRRKDIIILTFGDMLRIPGSSSSLEKERAEGANVSIVYSPLEALTIAKINPDRKIIFLGIGFETTAPAIALSIIAAKKARIKNIFFLTSLKLVLPVMRYLLLDKRLKLDAFLCPGHVSAIIGTKGYEFIAKKYKIPCCVTGFEPLDILEGIYLILKQIRSNKPEVANQYTRVVTKTGNLKAKRIISRVFKKSSADWRGFGNIYNSGLKIRTEFSLFDAEKVFPNSLAAFTLESTKGCLCGDVLKGLINPDNCPLFGKACTPDNPVGPCMVSNEGACNAYFRYR
ncbi:MAG: hydrogenase formation protein HypD [Candidatus Omnitrophica bacterium CG08_land_8_20_14_0_20_41_16]|uniref:Hydrogenase formation protein HypD n=1 Tax=Candidatus Sherwoodlollariibacterium unditelluris TaxID=1974757 RepID=A0A2G9YJ13_9BACT|nr:MAG: hydrogenase formation protein HypD [Candidatus Omnitrophica bacterium CG23_combo_of_CG06-09_8_20_14_all_41_10]PIS34082.1 MAG: hydrogenase formation protein HypD [Candidatus Omnitrophica bacterium CG08_land_8_20_14_0_20_41_16]